MVSSAVRSEWKRRHAWTYGLVQSGFLWLGRGFGCEDELDERDRTGCCGSMPAAEAADKHESEKAKDAS